MINSFIIKKMETNHSRRRFLKVTAAGALGAFTPASFTDKTTERPVFNSSVGEPEPFSIGLQLYTIRDAMEKDAPGSLKTVSDAGYKYVELASYRDRKFYNYEPAEFRKLVNGLGMKILSSHASVKARGLTLDDAKKMAEDHAILGVKYCIHPWVDEEFRRTVSSYKKMIADWNMVGKVMKENGIQFGYHNHNFEFDTIEGKVPFFDILMVELDKELITFELDLFWTIKAGQNPVEIFKKYPGRFQIFHLKDMYTSQASIFTTSGVSDFAPVGSGIIDFKTILAAKKIAGMKYMIVEQDSTKDGSPFDAIKISINNLTTKILV
jgi:sugar phosphate isomerase/epimerase